MTFIAAVVHSIGSYIFTVPEGWKNTLLIISITFPAIGAALHGYVAQRQFRRNSERYRTMAGVLAQVRADMAEATEIKQVQDVARETEQDHARGEQRLVRRHAIPRHRADHVILTDISTKVRFLPSRMGRELSALRRRKFLLGRVPLSGQAWKVRSWYTFVRYRRAREGAR